MSAYQEAKSLFSDTEKNIEGGADREGAIAKTRDSSISKFRAMQELAGLSNLPQLTESNRSLLERVSARIAREDVVSEVPVHEVQNNVGKTAPLDGQFDYAFQPVKAARG